MKSILFLQENLFERVFILDSKEIFAFVKIWCAEYFTSSGRKNMIFSVHICAFLKCEYLSLNYTNFLKFSLKSMHTFKSYAKWSFEGIHKTSCISWKNIVRTFFDHRLGFTKMSCICHKTLYTLCETPCRCLES